MTISALHGFLGRPQDFDGLGLQLNCIDYLKTRELSPAHDFETWGQNLNRYVQTQIPGETKRILVGYSLGGRLALHAVRQNPQLWSGLVLISTNPGIPGREKASRIAADKVWAEKFETMNFEKVTQQWNAQPVFQNGYQEPIRQEFDFNRRLLAGCLTQWSVGLQDDFHRFLASTKVPVAYISGEKDLKYVGIGQSLNKANPQIQIFAVANSGHRVLFDQPRILASLIEQFALDRSRE